MHLLGSGSILNEALKAAEILKKDYDIFPEVWSVTSYKNLYDNAIETERSNRVKGKKVQAILKNVWEQKMELLLPHLIM